MPTAGSVAVPGVPGGPMGMPGGAGALTAGARAAPAPAAPAPALPKVELPKRKGYDWVIDVISADRVVLQEMGEVHLAGVDGPRPLTEEEMKPQEPGEEGKGEEGKRLATWTEGYEEARAFTRELLVFHEVRVEKVGEKEVRLTLERPVFLEGETTAVDVNRAVADNLRRVALWQDRSGQGFQVVRNVTGARPKESP